MNRVIDCFFIGHNEMDFEQYEKTVRKMGIHSGAYRDLDKNFIRLNGKPYHLAQAFNFFRSADIPEAGSLRSFFMGETFSAAIAYLGTYLNRRGLTFDYVNSFQENKEELSRKLETGNIRTIAIITTLYIISFPIIEIVDFVRKHDKEVKIILGGPYVATQIRSLDSKEINYFFKSGGADIFVDSSQGETALVKIIKALKNNLPLHQVENIYYKSGNRYVSTAKVKENNILSENMVDWSLFSDRPLEYVNVRSSISCPFFCSFCGFPEHAGKYQVAGVKDLENELNSLVKIKSLKCVNFIDDTFNVPIKRFKEILRMMIKSRYNFKWHSHFRCQFADRETVALMKESGCEGVFLGIESGSDKILKNMNKSVRVTGYLEGIELLKEYGITTFGSFIIGFPGETAGTIKETTKFIEESHLDFYRAQLWYCEPITPIFRQREKYDIRGSYFEWSHSTMDAKQAYDSIDEMFLSIKEKIWVPQYNFEFDGIFHLLQRGLSIEQVKRFLKSFNRGVEEKLIDPTCSEVSIEVLKGIKESLGESNRFDDSLSNNKEKLMNKYDAKFDF